MNLNDPQRLYDTVQAKRKAGKGFATVPKSHSDGNGGYRDRLRFAARWLLERFDAFFALSISATLGDELKATGTNSLTEFEAALSAEQFGGNGSRLIDEKFARASSVPRQKLFVRVAILGILIYDVYLFSDALVVPDVAWLAAFLKLVIVTPATIALIVCVWKGRIDANLAAGLTVGVMVSIMMVILLSSRSPNASLYAVAPVLVIVGANVWLALPFQVAAIYSLAFTCITATCIMVHPTLDTAEKIYPIVCSLVLIVYSLVGNYRIESSLRRAYVLVLKENLKSLQLAEANLRLKMLVDIDGLTGIGNRRSFDEQIEALWRLHLMERQSLAVLLIDIDHFKRLNDRSGHQIGDQCLRQVAKTLSQEITARGDYVGRYGGEEFVAILRNSELSEAYAVAEKLRLVVAQSVFMQGPATAAVMVTVSIGCAAIVPTLDGNTFELVAAADRALYDAKMNGRNRTEVQVVMDKNSQERDTIAIAATA